ncbi:MAG: NfeD family protein [Acidimicrobiia bacterium]|nr:NfeD family protein [Acidimicrobiia bacterium]MDX2468307.1 NfeD family protein [Acidimicrobiia bacterium]
MLRRLTLLLFVLSAVVAVVPASAQDAQAGPVVVADVRGPLDQRALDFLVDAVLTDDAQLVVLKIDNPGIASGDPAELFAAIQETDNQVVAWVGPDGAVAYGGAGQLLGTVAVAGAAPGARIGHMSPTVAGQKLSNLAGEDVWELRDTEIVIRDESTSELVDVVQPPIGQFIAALDGMAITTNFRESVLETAEELTLEDGSTVISSSVEVRFLKPTLLTRFLRLGTRPDAAFFFLLAGLAVGAFEFYAAGGGIAAAMAALSLFLAGYGFATLPMNWLAVVAAVLGVGFYTWDFQRHELGIRSIVGTVLMLWGGIAFVGGSPQIGTSVWSVLLTVVGITLFYLFAMTTIVRSRFGTPTIGREHLVGAIGVAESALTPDGVVTIEGAKWRARSHRAAGIDRGAAIEVLAVEGITLQVAPPE